MNSYENDTKHSTRNYRIPFDKMEKEFFVCLQRKVLHAKKQKCVRNIYRKPLLMVLQPTA